MKNSRFAKRGFTLIELLVVLAVLSIVGCLLLPARARTRIKSSSSICLSNLRQMMVGWSLYKDENNDVLMPNAPLGAAPNQSWCSGTSEDWFFANGNTNSTPYKTSLLAPYVGNDISIYRCPADVIPSANGIRLRSYSMNSQMGAIYNLPNYTPPYLLYVKGSDLTCPPPMNAFIFADEHPVPADGYIQIDCVSGGFPDPPAAWHQGGAGFSFADGHAEIHKWNTAVLLGPITAFGSANYPSNPSGKNNADWIWLAQHTACTNR